jgi:tetratricopeptide (TPR) repeat protein
VISAVSVLHGQGSAQQRFLDEIPARENYIKGLAAYELGDYDKALKLLHQAYLTIPAEAALSFALAETYLKLEDLQKATVFAKEAVERDRSNKWYRLKLADIYQKTNQYDASQKVMKALLEVYPTDAMTLSLLADVQAKQKKYQDAIKTLNRLLSINGESWSIYYQKYQYFNALDRKDSSVVMLEKMQVLEPDNLITLQLLSKLYSEKRDSDRAKEALKEALLVNSRDPETLLMLADIYIAEAKWDSVSYVVSQFVSDDVIDPAEKLPFIDHIYKVYQQQATVKDRTTWMKRILSRYVEAHPQYGPAYEYAAQLLLELGDTDEAIDRLNQAVLINGNNDLSWELLLQLLMSQDRYEEVIAKGLKAEALVPENPNIIFWIGSAYLKTNKPTEATLWLEYAAELPTREAFQSVIYTELALAYHALGKDDLSYATFENALILDPQNPLALSAYALALSQDKDLIKRTKAQNIVEKALDLNNQNAEVYHQAGMVYIHLGNAKKARDLIKKSVELVPDNADALEHLGDAYQTLEDRARAVEFWRKALLLDPKRSYLSDRIR